MEEDTETDTKGGERTQPGRQKHERTDGYHHHSNVKVNFHIFHIFLIFNLICFSFLQRCPCVCVAYIVNVTVRIDEVMDKSYDIVIKVSVV